MIITTTNFIENAKIEQYLGIVTANCVVGTNVISDLAASFTDFFGGMSNTYQRKLQVLYDAAMATLKEDARKKGANAIVGLGIDFDEISGKGKSMFMVSVVGTAVRIDKSSTQLSGPSSGFSNSIEISSSLIEKHVIRTKIINKISSLEAGEYLTESDFKDIIDLEIDEVVGAVCDKYIEACLSYNSSEFKLLFNQYLSRIGYEKAVEPIYARFVAHPGIISEIIDEQNLFYPQKVAEMLPSLSIEDVVALIQSEKESYCSADIAPMEQIVEYFDTLPDLGQIVEMSSLLGGCTMKYICQCGHKNSVEKEFCVLCDKNIKGLTEADIDVINDFKLKVEFLKSKFNK